MPVGFSSAARNLFLLGSTGAQVVSNFFKRIDQSAGTDGVYLPDEIRFNALDEKFLLAGSASDSNLKDFGWFEKRTTGGTADWDVRVEATQGGINTILRAMELDSNNNLIVVGKTGGIPWIAKYDNDGVIDWQSTTNSGDVEYTGITSDSNGNYYACGSTPISGEATAFVEKFDASGNPGWGKAAFMLGRDVVLNKVAANNRDEVVAVGYLEDDSSDKGYIVKIDTTTGEVLWDRTLNDNSTDPVVCNDVFIDDNDQIYLVGNVGNKGYIVKYTAEGNIIWQKFSANTLDTITYENVKSDSETEQTIVFGTYDDGSNKAGILTKYSKNGDLVWRRILYSSFNFTDTFSNVNLDADPSFYYILFTDEEINELNGNPFSYTFGKVSSSGNGLGNFEYFDGSGETIYYEILGTGDEIGRLSDGSVRQDSSDLITYPFSANKLLFDDLATQISNKKRQMDGPDSFEYSGSPAIRPADFQELNIDGSNSTINEEILAEFWSSRHGQVAFTRKIRTDSLGNLYVSGYLFNAPAGGNVDLILIKYNSSGIAMFDVCHGTSGIEEAYDLDVDSEGNIYVCGKIWIDGTNGGAMVSKYNSSGVHQWTNSLGIPFTSLSNGIKVGASGDVYVVGRGTSSSKFVAKYNSSGTLQWQKEMSSGSDFRGESVTLDSSDNIYIVANLGTSSFVDGVITKYNSSGTLQWQKYLGQFGDPNFSYVGVAFSDITIDSTGSYLYACGSATRSSGSWETLVVKYDTSGSLIWQRTYSGFTGATSIAIDSDSNVYVSSFGTGVLKYDLDGNFIWGIDFTNNIIALRGIATSSDGSLYVSGDTNIDGSNRIVTKKLDTNGLYPESIGGHFISDVSGSSQTPALQEATSTRTDSTGSLTSLTNITMSSFTFTSGFSTDVEYVKEITVEDISGKSNDSVVNGATYNAAGYWEFDGIDDEITIPYTPNLAFTDAIMSCEAWIYVDSLSSAFSIINKRGNNVTQNNNRPYVFEVNTDGRVRWILDLATTVCDTATGLIQTGQWYHLAATHDGTNAKVYVNGVESVSVSSGTSSLNDTGNVPVRIGWRYANSSINYSDGRIGEVRVYPRALTPAQVFQNYNATREKYTGVPASTDPGLTSTRTPV